MPTCADIVRAHHQDGLVRPWDSEFLRLPVCLTDYAIIRDKLLTPFSLYDSRGNISHTCKPNHLRVIVQHRHTQCSPDCSLSCIMSQLNQVNGIFDRKWFG